MLVHNKKVIKLVDPQPDSLDSCADPDRVRADVQHLPDDLVRDRTVHAPLFLLSTGKCCVCICNHVPASLATLLRCAATCSCKPLHANLVFIPQLIELIHREETLRNVISSVTRNLRSIIFTFILAVILVYFFSIVGFMFLQGIKRFLSCQSMCTVQEQVFKSSSA